ncbi:MAG: diguanylate cyclase [Burkholderiaceae bacterium]|nr:diguanylate cyclase [Burkholderiaceae bacterium]
MLLRLPFTRFPNAETLQVALSAAQRNNWTNAIEATACAWYLRQVDSTCVETVAHALLPGNQFLHLSVPERQECRGYLNLALAEARWLNGNKDDAEHCLTAARECFGAIDRCHGSSDADWLEAQIAHDLGRTIVRERLMQESLRTAESLGDHERIASSIVALACFDMFVESSSAKTRWHDSVAPHLNSDTPSLRAFANQFLFLVRLSEGAHHLAIEHAVASLRASEQSGLQRRAISAGCNVALSFTDLGDLDSALLWLEAALEKARTCGWPHPLGYCLTAMAGALLKAGRNQAALEVAREAGTVLAPFAQTTEYFAALTVIGDAALACGDLKLAGESYSTVSLPNCPSEYPKTRHYGLLGLARLAERAGELNQAHRLCVETLELPAEMPDYALDVDAMRLLSQVIHRQSSSSPAEVPAHSIMKVHDASSNQGGCPPAQHFVNSWTDPIRILDDAISLADARLDGAGRHVLLLDKASVLEKKGSYQGALATLRAAMDSLEAEREKSAARLSLSLEIRFKTEHALAEAELHKQIAATEAARSAELESLNLQLQTAVESLQEAQELLMQSNKELSSAHAQIMDLSVTDPLTGMRNRRFLSQVIDTAVAECLRSYDCTQTEDTQRKVGSCHKDIVFFLLDLDHFKQVNDRFGHAAGDAVLIQLRDRLRMVTRDQDFLVRWGGEEFLVAVCGIDRAEAPTIAERLRLSVSCSMFDLGKGQKISKTVSIGFASFPVDPESPGSAGWEQAVEIADARLYCAKAAGRDQWVGDQSSHLSPTLSALPAVDLDGGDVICQPG